MGAWNAISDIIGATTTPSPNPYYGAQLLTPEDHPSITKPTWVDATGTPIPDDHAAALSSNPQLASQPFNNPGFWAKLGKTGQEEQAANLSALAYPGSQAQQLQSGTRRIIGEGGAATTSDINRINAFGNMPNSSIATASGLGMVNPSNLNIFNRTIADQNAGVPAAQAGEAAAVANRGAAAATPEANPYVASNAVRQAQYVEPYGQLASEVQSLYPGIGGTSLNIGHIDPNSGIIGQVRNPVQSLQGVMFNNALGGNLGVTSSGNQYQKPPPVLSVQGLNGTAYNADTSANGSPNVPPAGNLTPLAGTHYQHDANGALYYDGKYVPEENYKGTPIEAALKHQMGLEDKIKKTIGTHSLPHGLGFELGDTANRMWQNSHIGDVGAMIGKGYHSVIGE